MTSPNHDPTDREMELQLKEAQLRQRELELRLRELESEITQPPLHQTRRHQEPESKVQRRKKTLIRIAQFLGAVVAVVVVLRIAAWLTSIVMIGLVAWVLYKLFLDKK